MALLLQGDCLEVMKDLSANSIDCFVCDLPYGCLSKQDIIPALTGDHHNRTKAMTGCEWDVKINLEEFWKQVKRLAKDDHTPVLMFCTTKFGYELIKSNEKWFRYDLVWDKQRGVSFLSANKMPMRSHEMIYVFSKAGAHYERVDISGNFQKWNRTRDKSLHSSQYGGAPRIIVENGGDGKRCALSVIQQSTITTKGGHPTEKPVALYEWLIARYCPKGGTILDPTAGSFNSVQAALNLGRKAIGIEKDTTFFEKAEKRFQQTINEIVDAPPQEE